METTRKQLTAIENLSSFLGEKPRKVRTVEEADREIKRLIPLVKEREADMAGAFADYSARFNDCL